MRSNHLGAAKRAKLLESYLTNYLTPARHQKKNLVSFHGVTTLGNSAWGR